MRQLALAYRASTLALALSIGSVQAHELQMPAQVQADAGGHFSIDVVVVLTSATEFASSTTDGTDNTSLGNSIADGFCYQLYQPGNYASSINGQLLNPALDGTVLYYVSYCDGWNAQRSTTIRSATVGADESSWSAIKALYR